MKPIVYTWGNKLLSNPADTKLLGERIPYLLIQCTDQYSTTPIPCNRGTMTSLGSGQWRWTSDSKYDWSGAFENVDTQASNLYYDITIVEGDLVEHTDRMFHQYVCNGTHVIFPSSGQTFGTNLVSAQAMFQGASGVYVEGAANMTVTSGVLDDVSYMFDTFNISSTVNVWNVYPLLSAANPTYHEHCFRGVPDASSAVPADWR